MSFIRLGACAILATGYALALNTVSYVSSSGNDANPCTFAQPCRHFNAAIAATDENGYVHTLTPGDYLGFAVTKSITIDGDFNAANLNISAGLGAATGIKVVLRNMEATSIAMSLIGGHLTLENVTLLSPDVPNYSGLPLDMILQSGSTLQLTDVAIRGPRGGRVSGPGCEAHLNRVSVILTDKSKSGFEVDSCTATIRNSVFRGSAAGLLFAGASGPAFGFVTGSEFTNNAAGLMTKNSAFPSEVRIDSSTFTFNLFGVNEQTPGTVITSRNNNFYRNGADGAPATAASLK